MVQLWGLLVVIFTVSAGVGISADAAPATLVAFEQAVEIVKAGSKAYTGDSEFCRNLELACGGRPIPVRARGVSGIDGGFKGGRTFFVATQQGGTEVVVMARMAEGPSGDFYVSDTHGALIRSIHVDQQRQSGDRVTQIPFAQAQYMFTEEKRWWMDWLAAHPK